MKLANWKFILLTCLSCAAVFAAGMFVAYALRMPTQAAAPVRVMANAAGVSNVQAAAAPSPTLAPKPAVSESYMVGIQDGNVAVFITQNRGQPVLKQKTSIAASFLPAEERERLRVGIPAKDDYQISKILEAYGS